MLRDILSKTLKVNFVQLIVFCGVALESSSFVKKKFNSILALLESSFFFISILALQFRTVKSWYRPYFDVTKKAEFNVSRKLP